MRHIFFALAQDPWDTSSGAAISTRLLAEALAAEGIGAVSICAPSWREGGGWLPSQDFVESIEPAPVFSGTGTTLRFQRHGVTHCIICAPEPGLGCLDDTGKRRLREAWENELRAAPRSSTVFTYGSSEDCRHFRASAVHRGHAVAFLAHNEALAEPRQVVPADVLICPSRYLAHLLEGRFGIPACVCPPLLDPRDPPPLDREPLFTTFVNPSPEKGVAVFARIATESVRRELDIPYLVVGGRSGFAALRFALETCGERTRTEAAITVLPRSPKASGFLRHTRVLLVPSLFEAAGRVVVEAMAAGVPCLVSDRGGLPETLGGGGVCLPLPPPCLDGRTPPTGPEIECWIEALRAWYEDAPYVNASTRALSDSVRFCAKRALGPLLHWLHRD